MMERNERVSATKRLPRVLLLRLGKVPWARLSGWSWCLYWNLGACTEYRLRDNLERGSITGTVCENRFSYTGVVYPGQTKD